MKRVEMLGVMGAGKSTLYQSLISSTEWTNKRGFETAISEKENIFLREARRKSFGHWLSLKLLLGIPRMRDLLVTKNLTKSAWESLWDQQEVFREILKLMLNKRVTRETHLPLSALRVHQTIEEAVNVAHLLAHGECEIVLHDESLLTRGFGAAMDSGDSVEFIDAWSSAVPMPSMIICVNSAVDVIKRRIQAREKRLSEIHEQKVEEVMELMGRIKQEAVRRKVPILEVDGTQESAATAKKCLEFMSGLQR